MQNIRLIKYQNETRTSYKKFSYAHGIDDERMLRIIKCTFAFFIELKKVMGVRKEQ